MAGLKVRISPPEPLPLTAGMIYARLDPIPATRTIWKFVVLLSLGFFLSSTICCIPDICTGTREERHSDDHNGGPLWHEGRGGFPCFSVLGALRRHDLLRVSR